MCGIIFLSLCNVCYFHFVRKHRTRVTLAITSLIISKCATIQAPLLLGNLIDALCESSGAKDVASENVSSVSTEISSALMIQNVPLADPTLVFGTLG